MAHIDGHELKLTNLDKVFWPDEGITKGDVIDYYRRIAPIILPYLRDRAQALHRHPNGIAGQSFFQKDVDEAPDWAITAKIESESDGKEVDYLVCQDEATLAWMANLGCIEINPWSSRIQSTNNPDYLVVDLDPLERSFDDVIRVAKAAHEILESIQAPSVPKTSGSKGLHIFVPLGARYTYDQVKQFANDICRMINQELPELTSLERAPKKRVGKVYLDYLRNTLGQTMAAPYSLRPKPGAPVSTPLHWHEVEPGLEPARLQHPEHLPAARAARRSVEAGNRRRLRLRARPRGAKCEAQAGLKRFRPG